MSFMQVSEELGDRAETPKYVEGLRALADFLSEHPEHAERWRELKHGIPVSNLDQMLKTARTIGGHWDKEEDEFYYRLVKKIGGGVVVRIFVERAQVCERVQVGTRTVERPAPGQEIEYIKAEEPVYEWKCPESLLALSGADHGDA